MTVREIAEKNGLTIITGADSLENEVTGGYCGDLLSWVMGRAKEGDAWFTVMGNVNSVAVAVLTDVACIILCEGAKLDQEALNKAKAQDVAVLSTDKNSFSAALEISKTLGL